MFKVDIGYYDSLPTKREKHRNLDQYVVYGREICLTCPLPKCVNINNSSCPLWRFSKKIKRNGG